MQKPTLDELIRLPETAAIRAFFDGENNAFLRQLMSAASILSVVLLIVGLSEERYRSVGVWLTLLMLVGAVFAVRSSRFYERNVRYLMMALLIALLMAVVLTAPDSLARVIMAGILLPIALIFCRLTTRQYLALGTVYLATAAWFALRPGGLEFPKDAVPALVGCASSTLIIVAFASRITRKKTNRFVTEWSRERDRFTEHTRMQSELNDARTIQLSMLPREPPHLAWLDYSSISLPATEVGGDYFEYFQLSDSKLAVVIGDVAGHGVASGLVLSGVRSGLHLLRDELAQPLDVLENLNSMVRDTAPGRMFVTLQIALVDRDNEMLTVANAGHPPLLLLPASSNELLSLGTEGLPLGTRLDPGLDEQSHSIRAGDTLVFYTDGVFEICNLQGECFGEERLEGQVHRSEKSGSARQIRDDILNGVSNFKGDAAQEDDLTLLVLKLRQP
jgi:serine phosphatase RsbU (regulator of sigma subunit)